MKRVLHAPKNAVLCAFFVFIKSTHCAKVFANLDVTEFCDKQKSLCPHTEYDKHVVCEYYFQDIYHYSLRSQAARGQAIGKDQQTLPQAYGMMEVDWDPELASIARIMVNQCPETHRHYCAATEKFTDPIMIFMYGSQTDEDTAPEVIIADILAVWDSASSHMTTADEILSSPDLKRTGHGQGVVDMTGEESLLYIKMVVANVTHIGCAAAVHEQERNSNRVLSGQLLCYLSHHSEPGTLVYNTTAPISGTMYTRCGCPPKYKETKDCLCDLPPPSTKRPDPTTNQTDPSTHQTSSTPAYYNNINNYQKYLDEMFKKFQKSIGLSTEPPFFNSTGKVLSLIKKERTPALWIPPPTYFTDKPQVSLWKPPIDWTSTSHQELETTKPLILKSKHQKKLQWAPQQILEPIVQNNMRWATQQVLEPIVQKKEKWTLQLEGTQPTIIPKPGGRTPSKCNTGVNCPPRIVMLPVFSVQNVHMHNSRKSRPGQNRRFGNTSLVHNTIADDDFSFSEEDEIPQNLSLLRSKLLQTVRKIRKNDLLHFFSQEQNLKPVYRQMETTRSNQSILEPIEPKLEPYKSTLVPSERNSATSERNLEFIKHILEPNLPVQTMIPRSYDDHNEQGKKRAMNLLDEVEKRGMTARLNSREIVHFDTKMRRIYKTWMQMRDQIQF